MLFLTILLFQIRLLPNFLFNDGSTGWHLSIGRYILERGWVPYQDFISYTMAGKPWIAFYWLPDLFMALAGKIGSYNGIATLVASTIALLFLLLYERCRRAGCNFVLSGFLILLGAVISTVHWLARPHVMTFVGTYVFASMIDDFHKGKISAKKLLIGLSVMMLAWVNSHPGFVIGFAILAIYGFVALVRFLITAKKQNVFPELKGLFLTGLGCVATTFINPYGIELHKNLGEYLGQSKVVDYVDEYLSPVFHGSLQTASLEVLFFLVVIGMGITRVRPSIPQTLTVLAFGHLALNAMRNLPLFVIVALPYVAELFSQTKFDKYVDDAGERGGLLGKLAKRWQSLNAGVDATEAQCTMHLLPALAFVFFMAVSAAGGSLFGQQVLSSGFDKNRMPTKTLECIRQHDLDPHHGFNQVNWGGYINYQAGIPIFIDDRASFYGEEFYLNYGNIISLFPGWQDQLDRLKIKWVLFPKADPFAQRLKSDPNWRLLCEDEAAYLFVRN